MLSARSGTSPLYTLSTILGCNTDAPSKYQCVVVDGVTPDVAEDIKSVLSVIVWALLFIVRGGGRVAA